MGDVPELEQTQNRDHADRISAPPTLGEFILSAAQPDAQRGLGGEGTLRRCPSRVIHVDSAKSALCPLTPQQRHKSGHVGKSVRCQEQASSAKGQEQVWLWRARLRSLGDTRSPQTFEIKL